MDTQQHLLAGDDVIDLKTLAAARTVVVGVGNPLRGDDGLGPALIARLQGRCSAPCIDAGTVPENYVRPVIRTNPDTILFVDAVDLGLPAGSWTLLCRDDLSETGLTTHTASLRTLIDFLQAQIRADVYIVAVQPETLAFGAELSPAVQRTLDTLASLLQE